MTVGFRCALIVVNGKIKAQGTQFSLEDVEVCCVSQANA